MAQNSAIEWTDHTFNPWQGCVKVGPECAHCYAETFDKRQLYVKETHWGKDAPRLFRNDDHWEEPERWHRNAQRLNQRRRVFCASMADVFENRRDLDAHRHRLWQLIERTPMLDWLLLTKRPQHINEMIPPTWIKHPMPNVWFGTSVGVKNRLYVINELQQVPAAIRFLSLEPLLEDLGTFDLSGINWAIAGGESGPGARALNVEWVRPIRDRCNALSIPFFFKQWGKLKFNPNQNDPTAKEHGGTAKGGRLLDGRTWDQFPK